MTVCEKFGLDHEVLLKYEKAAEAAYPENAYRFEKSYVAQKCEEAELCEEHRKLILDFMDFAVQDEDILRFMWLYFYFQFETDECFMDHLWGDGLDGVPVPEVCDRVSPGVLKSVVYLIASDHLSEFLKKQNLPESYMTSYYEAYKKHAQNNIISHNTYGLCRYAPFMYTYAYPFILRIGRLTYQVLSFKDYCEVYEDEEGKRTILALPNYTYNEQGYQDVTSSFRPVYKKNGDMVLAHTFDEKGLLSEKALEYDLKKLTKVYSPGDKVITIHIPGDGKLSPELVEQSLKDAEVILGKCFAKYHWKGFVCQTWFLDTQLREVLPPESNMLKFQDRFDLVMAGDNRNHSLFEHIFRVKPTDLSNLVPKNCFQEVMLQRAVEGKKMYWGFGILKRDHI